MVTLVAREAWAESWSRPRGVPQCFTLGSPPLPPTMSRRSRLLQPGCWSGRISSGGWPGALLVLITCGTNAGWQLELRGARQDSNLCPTDLKASFNGDFWLLFFFFKADLECLALNRYSSRGYPGICVLIDNHNSLGAVQRDLKASSTPCSCRVLGNYETRQETQDGLLFKAGPYCLAD